jgi:hypothetical protein
MSDVGISFKNTTLDEAWRLLARVKLGTDSDFSPARAPVPGSAKSQSVPNFPEDADAADVIETLAAPAGNALAARDSSTASGGRTRPAR